jgi:hypothetical protein
MITVIFPVQFTKILNGNLTHHAEGKNLSEVLKNICFKNNELQKHVFLESGEISPFIAFAVGGSQNVHSSSMTRELSLKPDDVIEIILPVAGG